MSQQLISQQYYTRARQGIFRSTEGYDTIAKSDSLDNHFIKKTLHPFCGYDAPKELQKRSERNVRLYPESLVFFHSETGELILGRSVYVGADFTGQRNTFFTHNYVIPASRREEFLKEPAKIFTAGGFASQHDVEDGKSLPGLASIPSAGVSQAGTRPMLVLRQLGIDETLFKQLLYAVMSSITSKKKVYIILDTDVSDSSLRAKELLEILFGALPYELRRHFGFMTYSSEPESKKHINVMFVEKGSIRAGDQQIDKDFLFDFPNKRFANVDLQGSGHEYLDYAWQHLERQQRLESFYGFVEEVLSGAASETTLRVATYYQLAALYQIEQGEVDIYLRNKAGSLYAIAELVSDESLRQKHRLHELFMSLFREESRTLSPRNLPPIEVMKMIGNYYRLLTKESEQSQFASFFVDVLRQATEAQQREYVEEVYQLLLACERLFSLVITSILTNSKDVKLFEAYLVSRLKKSGKAIDVLKEIDFWMKISDEAVQNRFLQERVHERIMELFENEHEKLETLLALHQFFASFTGPRTWTEHIIAEAEQRYLNHVDLESLTRGSFESIVAILKEKPQVFLQKLDHKSRRVAKLILACRELLANSQVYDPAEFFTEMSREDASIVSQMLRNLVDTSLDREHFLTITFAFYNADSPEVSPYHFHEMLRYVHQKGGTQKSRDFISWSMSRHIFFARRALLSPYKEGLKQYFIQDAPEALRDKQERKKWYAIKHLELRKVLEEVSDEMSSGMARFFRKYLDKLLMVVAGIVSIGVITWVVVLSMGDPSPAKIQPTPDIINDVTGNQENAGVPGEGQQNVPGQQPATGTDASQGGKPAGTDDVPGTTAPADSNKPGTSNVTSSPASTGNPTSPGNQSQQGTEQKPKTEGQDKTGAGQQAKPAAQNNPNGQASTKQ